MWNVDGNENVGILGSEQGKFVRKFSTEKKMRCKDFYDSMLITPIDFL